MIMLPSITRELITMIKDPQDIDEGYGIYIYRDLNSEDLFLSIGHGFDFDPSVRLDYPQKNALISALEKLGNTALHDDEEHRTSIALYDNEKIEVKFELNNQSVGHMHLIILENDDRFEHFNLGDGVYLQLIDCLSNPQSAKEAYQHPSVRTRPVTEQEEYFLGYRGCGSAAHHVLRSG